MDETKAIGLDDVVAVYSGPEAGLWRLLMGEQIHIGGFTSSRDLAGRAGIGGGGHGVDLCCCLGGGMRFLLRRGVERMTGVDATLAMLDEGGRLNKADRLEGRCELVHADVCATGLPAEAYDFVWGEDAWCYVVDKPALATEAVRLARPGAPIAVTDWVIGEAGLEGRDLERVCQFMKFPNMETAAGWSALLEALGCEVEIAEGTGRFARYVRLYIDMLEMQLTTDALAIIGHDEAMLAGVMDGMRMMARLAGEGRIEQALIVARKK